MVTGHIFVNYTNSNGCTAASATDQSVIINAQPAPSIAGNTTVCSGSTGNVYSTTPGMSNYLWTINGGAITAGGGNANSTVTVTWGAAGTSHVLLNYTNSSGCAATTPTDLSVTINALPTPVITGSASVCTNSTGNIYTTDAGMTNYQWTVTGRYCYRRRHYW